MTSETAVPKPRASRAATRKTRRLYIVLAGMTMLGLAAALVLFAFQDSLVFFYTPSDLVDKDVKQGQRVRLGPKPEEGALRILLLGDSVAFGFGVADDQTFGNHLEELLATLVPDGAPRPVVMTVGCPGWNTRNCWAAGRL